MRDTIRTLKRSASNVWRHYVLREDGVYDTDAGDESE